MAELGEGFDVDLLVRFMVDDELLHGIEAHYYLMVDMSYFEMEGINHHRLAALYSTSDAYYQGHIRGILGGSYDPATQIFTLPTNHTGPIFIGYIENLIRLDMNLNSPIITDLAGNAPTQVMDVLPIIQDGRTLIPIRFIGDALGANIDWTNATDDRPLTVHLTLDGQSLSFGIGEITPQLAALGMNVPAQIVGDRTMVPLRFVSEFFGAVVNWDGETRSIEIISMGGTNPDSGQNPLTSSLQGEHMAIFREEDEELAFEIREDEDGELKISVNSYRRLRELGFTDGEIIQLLLAIKERQNGGLGV